MIKTAVAPLVFFTVVHGIASAGDIKRVGKVGLRALIYFEIVSTIALAIGLLWGNLLKIGSGMHDAHPSSAAATAASAAVAKGHASASTMDFIYGIFPDNFVGAFAGGQLLQVLVISVLFGFALLALRPERRSVIEDGLSRISECFFEFINLIMKFAPLGAFGSVAYAVGANGNAVLISLANLVLMFYVCVAFFIFLVLGGVCRISGFSLWRFLQYIIAIMLVTSKGAAAVSGGSFVVFAATVTAIGVLPVEGLALLFGVYRFMSMAIATCNTIGNSVATVVVSKWSGEFTEQTAKAEYNRVFGRNSEAAL